MSGLPGEDWSGVAGPKKTELDAGAVAEEVLPKDTDAEIQAAERPGPADLADDLAADTDKSPRRSAKEATIAAAELVPGWLAILVLVLLLAVAGLGGYLIRGLLTGKEQVKPADYAVNEWEAEVATDPNDPEKLLSLGYAYQEKGQYAEALATYDAVLKLDAKNTGALYNKGVVLTALNRPKDAEVVFWSLLEVAPDHALGAKALAQYYIGKKQYKSALVALEPVIAQRPEYADLQYLAGYSCEQLGLRPQAIAYYRGALKYNRDYPEAKDGLKRLGASE